MSGPREPYDENIHCGAKTKSDRSRQKGAPCIFRKGHRTDHPGVGRCWLHGGRAPITTGTKSKVYATNLNEAIARRVQDPDLLTLDNEIAYMKILIGQLQEEYEGRDQEDESGETKKLRVRLDQVLDSLRTLNTMVTTAYNMRFAKRFSIPVTELKTILSQIATAFEIVAEKYAISNEARNEFALRLSGLKTTQPLDPQLDAAGKGSLNAIVPEDWVSARPFLPAPSKANRYTQKKYQDVVPDKA
jgi:hypothetical protein